MWAMWWWHQGLDLDVLPVKYEASQQRAQTTAEGGGPDGQRERRDAREVTNDVSSGVVFACVELRDLHDVEHGEPEALLRD